MPLASLLRYFSKDLAIDLGTANTCVYARGKGMSGEKGAKLFDSTKAYESHSDVVVATRAGEIDVIGANVLDSVTVKTLPVNSKGHIADNTHFWFAVLKLQ